MDPNVPARTSSSPYDQSKYYLDAIRLTRWLVIFAVALTSWWLVPYENRSSVFAILAAGAAYNAGFYTKIMRRQPFFIAKPAMIAADTFFTLLLMLASGKAGSPYILLLVFMCISSAFWYGVNGVLIVSLSQLAVCISLFGFVMEPESWWNAELHSIVPAIAVFAAAGVFVAILTREERRERISLTELGREINQERQRLFALINSMSDAVMVVDKHGVVSIYNQSAAHMAGGKPMAGNSLNQLFIFKDSHGREMQLDLDAEQYEVSGRRDYRDVTIVRDDGSTTRLAVGVTPYIIERKQRGYIVVMADVTHDKKLEDLQKEFIEVASHELRTPLAIAEANIGTVLMPATAPTDPKVLHMLEVAHQNLLFLGEIITDLTTLSKADNDHLEIDLEAVEPLKLLNELEAEYRQQAVDKGLELRVEASDTVAPIITSRYHIKEILINFITNGLKFTGRGGVTLSVRTAEEPSEGVIFSVKDTGRGIEISSQKKLFNRFFRNEDYRTRETGGTGLGLYIAQKLAKRLNGKIWQESKLKKGSTFYLQVPPYSALGRDQKKVAAAETENFFDTI